MHHANATATANINRADAPRQCHVQVNYSDFYYPDSYSSEVGVFSSPDGRIG